MAARTLFRTNLTSGAFIRLLLTVTLACTVLSAGGEEDTEATPVIPIEQATSRAGQDFVPALEGKTVRIAGQVTENAFWALDTYLLPLRDENEDFGILIIGEPGVDVRSFQPGVVVEATGRIIRRNGMPVLLASRVVQTGLSEPTGSRQVPLADAAGFRNLALPVEVEGRVVELGDDGASEWLILTDGRVKVRIVSHRVRRDDEGRLARFRPGDRVRASGVVTQNAVLPPFDRFFQITLIEPGRRIVLVETAAMIPAYLLLTACTTIGALMLVWWVREQRKQGLRRVVEPMHAVGEEVLAASSLAEMFKKVQITVPPAARVSGVAIYLYDRKGRKLDRAGSRGASPLKASDESILLDNPANPFQATIGACFRNKAAVNIPDTRRSYSDERGRLGFKSDPVTLLSADLPRSVLALPMLAQEEIAGVMVFYRTDSVRYFHHDEQASAQHLANQVAAAMKVLEQRSVREQLFKSEKLAATGQLIAGVVNDLRSPVEAVLTMSQLLLFRGKAESRELELLAADAQRTAEIVSRLISFGKKEDAVARQIELNALVASLVQFREPEWKAAGIRFEDRTSRDGVYILGAQGQLEQVLLNVLLFAERAIADAGLTPKESVITIGTSLLGQRVLMDVDFPSPGEMQDPFAVDPEEDSEGGLAVLRGIIQGHGGEIRFEPNQLQGIGGLAKAVSSGGTMARIEIELPRVNMQQGTSGAMATAASPQFLESGSSVAATRTNTGNSVCLTALVLEPEPVNQRKFVAWMSRRGHRVIPVRSPEEALDLVQRVKCDVVACTSRMPGFHWHGFYERVRTNTDAFIVLLDSNSAGYAFAPGEGYILRKPLQETDFEQVLDAVTEHLSPPYAQAG